MNFDFIVVLTTVPREDLAREIARKLVVEDLVACAQIDSPIKSIYKWENKLEEDKEWRVIAKAVTKNFKLIEQIILEIHPYEVPQILGIPISEGHEPYLDWVNNTCSKKLM